MESKGPGFLTVAQVRKLRYLQSVGRTDNGRFDEFLSLCLQHLVSCRSFMHLAFKQCATAFIILLEADRQALSPACSTASSNQGNVRPMVAMTAGCSKSRSGSSDLNEVSRTTMSLNSPCTPNGAPNAAR